MIPAFPDFIPLSHEHKDAIEHYTRAFPPYSDYTFPSLWCWDLEEQCELSVLHGNLVVRLTDYVTNAPFLSFIGVNHVEAVLESLFSLLRNAPAHLPYLKLIPQHNLQNIYVNGIFAAAEDFDNHDYIYAIEDLATLPGRRYESQRWEANRFRKSFKPRVIELDLANSGTACEMEGVCRTWAERKRRNGQQVDNDVLALRRLFRAAAYVSHRALGVRVDGKLCAYAVVELNDSGYATSLFEHADTAYPGVFPFLRQQQALALKESGFEFLNHQQDLGIEGLRTSKGGWRPAFFLKKYIIRRTDSA